MWLILFHGWGNTTKNITHITNRENLHSSMRNQRIHHQWWFPARMKPFLCRKDIIIPIIYLSLIGYERQPSVYSKGKLCFVGLQWKFLLLTWLRHVGQARKNNLLCFRLCPRYLENTGFRLSSEEVWKTKYDNEMNLKTLTFPCKITSVLIRGREERYCNEYNSY
jgi:hypothetical protein